MKTSYKQTLRIHNQFEHGDMKFDCDQCEYKAKTKRNLRVHTLSKHTTQRNTKELSESAKKINLKVHKESKHVDIKSNCDQCENKATQKCHLSVHKQSKHEGIIIDCDQCEHKAKHKGSLRLHKQ